MLVKRGLAQIIPAFRRAGGIYRKRVLTRELPDYCVRLLRGPCMSFWMVPNLTQRPEKKRDASAEQVSEPAQGIWREKKRAVGQARQRHYSDL
jgi:hypothetical protein